MNNRSREAGGVNVISMCLYILARVESLIAFDQEYKSLIGYLYGVCKNLLILICFLVHSRCLLAMCCSNFTLVCRAK